MKLPTFKEWLQAREDAMPSSSSTPNVNPMQKKRENNKVGDIAARLAQQLKIVPGKVDDRQLQSIMMNPQVKALGPDAGKVIQALQGGDGGTL